MKDKNIALLLGGVLALNAWLLLKSNNRVRALQRHVERTARPAIPGPLVVESGPPVMDWHESISFNTGW